MIGFLKGEVEEIYEDMIVLDVGGVGLNVYMSKSSLMQIACRKSYEKVYTYLSVREDAMLLYGFLTKSDLDFFKLLIQVNGIGPKVGLTIMSSMSVEDLKFAILSGDSKTIAKAQGVGPKTAQRIILDLKDKITLEDAFNDKLSKLDSGEDETMILARNEAVEALCALGYSSKDSLKAVMNVENKCDGDVEAIIKLALKEMLKY